MTRRAARAVVAGLAAAALAASSPLAPPARAAAADAAPKPWAEIHYMLHCQGCHLPDGAGSPGRVPDLRGSVARYSTIPDGREYLVRVPGVAAAPLDDAELAAVLNWVVRRFGPGSAAQAAAPFTAAEVSALRRPAWTDVTARREELLRRLVQP